MSLTGACTRGEVRSSWPGSCRRACGKDGDEHRRSRRQIAASLSVKSVARRSDRTRDHKSVQSLRQARPRDRPCRSLYKQNGVTANQRCERLEWRSIPASQPKDYECTFIASLADVCWGAIPNWTTVPAWRVGGPALQRIPRARVRDEDHHPRRNRILPAAL